MKQINQRFNHNLSQQFTPRTLHFLTIVATIIGVVVLILPWLGLNRVAGWGADSLFFILADLIMVKLAQHQVNFLVSILLGVGSALIITLILVLYIGFVTGK